ncbi:MAG: DUF1801 domain-containing protein [Rhodobacteraceae bacterium]|nr:DUF1801 domain-containing protein [Paracoccaceae bacterium]
MSPADFIDSLPEARAAEARALDTIFRRVTGWQPKKWGGKLIGYGQYHYRYASGREGDFLATGFSPLASKISLHILPGYSEFPQIAARLGPHTRGKSCWYIKRLADVDQTALEDLIRAGLDDLQQQWPVEAT